MIDASPQSKPPIVLFGAGGHAAACIDVIEQEARFSIAGLFGLAGEVGGAVLDYRIIGTDDDLPSVANRCGNALVAIGQIKSPDIRVRTFEEMKRCGFVFPSIISPRAYVSPHAKLGEGTIVMHGAIVNARAVIGKNCIINSNALVEHDVRVGDHCHIATGASLNGGVVVEAESFVGSHCTVRQLVTLGRRSVIGMGHVVLKDCTAGTVLAGGA